MNLADVISVGANEAAGIINYLRALDQTVRGAHTGHTVAELVLEHGREFTPAERPLWCEQQEMKQCYRNALHLAVERELTYVEGFAIAKSLPMPIEHAWVADGTNALDPTWTGGVAYFGIPMDPLEAGKLVLKSGMYSVFSGGAALRRKILREGLPDGLVAA